MKSNLMGSQPDSMDSVRATRSLGPERQTLIEQFIGLLHMPYVAGCALLASIAGLPGIFLAIFLDTWDFNITYTRLVNPRGEFSSQFEGLASNIALTLMLFYIFYIIRYMRLRLARAEPELTYLASEGEGTLHKIFGRVSQPRPQILMMALAYVFNVPFLLSLWEITEGFPINRLQTLALYALLGVGFGSLIWVYLGPSWDFMNLAGNRSN